MNMDTVEEKKPEQKAVTSPKSDTVSPIDEEDREILEYFPPWKLQDFGLGRGIDGTDPHPWVNKSSLQVRDIIREDLRVNPASSLINMSQKMFKSNLIATNEGGIAHHFVQEVTNIKEQKAKLGTSITVPNSPVSVGVGADMSRSLTSTQKAIGRRVLKRTVAFKTEYSDIAEEQLAELILSCAGVKMKDTHSNTHLKMLQELELSEVENQFKAFVHRYRVTHYVSSITLGASKFTVQSESEYYKGASVSGKVGVQQVGQAKVSASLVEKKLKKSKNVQCVGKLRDDGSVEKEAVVDVKMEPISSLFLGDVFRQTMQGILTEFFREKEYGKEGPYFISCDDARVFLKVALDDKDHAFLHGTTTIEEASLFNIVLTDDGANPYEFYIGWQKSETVDMPGTIRYLNAPLSIGGHNKGPLSLESRGKKQNSVFCINNRLIDTICGLLQGSENINPEIWCKGFESFLIRCSRRSFGIDGFVAVQRTDSAAVEQYQTICRPSASGCDDRHLFMTFQLHSQDKKLHLSSKVTPETQAMATAAAESQEIQSQDGGQN